jgi:hypothetical protein
MTVTSDQQLRDVKIAMEAFTCWGARKLAHILHYIAFIALLILYCKLRNTDRWTRKIVFSEKNNAAELNNISMDDLQLFTLPPNSGLMEISLITKCLFGAAI